MAAAVTTIAATHGDAATRAEWRRRAEAAVTAQDEQRHLRALALFPDDAQMDNLLAEVHDGTIRTQDAPFLIRSALAHPTARGAVWRSVTDRWDDLTGLLPSNSIARLLEGVRALVGEVDPDVDSFLNDHPVPQGALMVAQHRERRLVNQRLRRRLLDGSSLRNRKSQVSIQTEPACSTKQSGHQGDLPSIRVSGHAGERLPRKGHPDGRRTSHPGIHPSITPQALGNPGR